MADYEFSTTKLEPQDTVKMLAVNGSTPGYMTGSELKDYVQNGIELKVSNRNLIDNPWFTVNQRGAASASGGYGVDRFQGNYTVASNGLSFATTNYIIQPIEDSLIAELTGKTLTFSVMFSDGTVESGSALYNPASWVTYVVNNKINAQNTDTGGFAVTARSSVVIRAIKVELGNQSTLAYDSAPDYATELLKCQRYFYRIGTSTYIMGFIRNSTNLYSQFMPYPVRMRAIPTITGVFNYVRPSGSWGSTSSTITSSDVALSNIDGFVISTTTGSGFSNYQSTHFNTSDMSFSADL